MKRNGKDLDLEDTFEIGLSHLGFPVPQAERAMAHVKSVYSNPANREWSDLASSFSKEQLEDAWKITRQNAAAFISQERPNHPLLGELRQHSDPPVLKSDYTVSSKRRSAVHLLPAETRLEQPGLNMTCAWGD